MCDAGAAGVDSRAVLHLTTILKQLRVLLLRHAIEIRLQIPHIHLPHPTAPCPLSAAIVHALLEQPHLLWTDSAHIIHHRQSRLNRLKVHITPLNVFTIGSFMMESIDFLNVIIIPITVVIV